ncbi:MAG: ABC transporter ATP-binding protein [Candidatus Aureabacteria bacterium]|nr:ABC transporter ATP-binding protein [Candidatus Auribacterota bacterium]
MVNNSPVVQAESLNFSYPDGVRALENISFQVGKGETVGVIGPNGAGKSTLLLHLNGILRGEGTVRIMGMEVARGNMRRIRQAVGLVFQDPEDQLFTPSVYDDVAFGPLNMRIPLSEVDLRVKRALAMVGMEGYEARSAHHLSVGEKKKVSLATVLALEPEIIALDEPTSNLDPGSREEFIGCLKKLSATKIIATHDLELVLAVCGRVMLLSGGRIVADGGVRELLANRALMEAHRLRVPLSLERKRH